MDLDNVNQAWVYFGQILDAGLKHYQVRLEAGWAFDDPSRDFVMVGSPDIGLFSGLCVQLFNIVTSDLPIRRCANETCGRTFSSQIGRAKKGSSRVDGSVPSCTASCLNSQMQRESRWRKRKLKMIEENK